MSTDRQTDRQTDDMPKMSFFGISLLQNVESHHNLEIDFMDQCNTFFILRIVEKVKSIITLITSFFFL